MASRTRQKEEARAVYNKLLADNPECTQAWCGLARLDKVRVISHNFGYGVGDDMDSLLARFVKD